MLVCSVDGLKDEDSSYRQALALGDPADRLACCSFCFLAAWCPHGSTEHRAGGHRGRMLR